jgi:NDP-sugar pyrophosphorylase family protein
MVADNKIALSCLPVNQLPLLAYQVNFFESNGIHDIFICVHQAEGLWKKVDKTLKFMAEKNGFMK